MIDRINGVIALSESKGAERLALLILADHENEKTGQCNPSIKTLAAEMNTTRRGAQKALRGLEERGDITTSRGGGTTSSSYTINVQPMTLADRMNVIRAQGGANTVRGANKKTEGANRVTPTGEPSSPLPANRLTLTREHSSPKPEREPEGLNQKNKQKEEDLPFPEKVKREFSNWVDELTEAIGETPSGDLEKARAGYSELRAKNFTSLALSLAIRGAVGNDQVRDKAKDMVWILDPVRVEMLITMGRSTETSEPVAA